LPRRPSVAQNANADAPSNPRSGSAATPARPSPPRTPCPAALPGCGPPRPSESHAPSATSAAESPSFVRYNREQPPTRPARTSVPHRVPPWPCAQTAAGCWLPNPADAPRSASASIRQHATECPQARAQQRATSCATHSTLYETPAQAALAHCSPWPAGRLRPASIPAPSAPWPSPSWREWPPELPRNELRGSPWSTPC